MLEVSRRRFLTGLIGAPFIVRYSSLMPVKSLITDGEAIKWIQTEMESRLMELLSSNQPLYYNEATRKRLIGTVHHFVNEWNGS